MKQRYYWAMLLGVLVVTVVSTVMANLGWYNPLERLANRLPWGDKFGHFVLAGGLAFTLNLILRARKIVKLWVAIYWSDVIIGALAILEEGSQVWFPARSVSFSDLMAGLLGMVLMNRMAAFFIHRQAVRSHDNT